MMWPHKKGVFMKKVFVSVLIALSALAHAEAKEQPTCYLSATQGQYSVWYQSYQNAPRQIATYSLVDFATQFLDQLFDNKVCKIGVNQEICEIVPRSTTEFALYRGPVLVAVYFDMKDAAKLQNKLLRYGACIQP
jgi:hypothetical protein